MALEDLAPTPGAHRLSDGREVKLRRVSGQHAIRFLALVRRFKDQLGLRALDARELNISIKGIMELAGRLLEGLAAEVDLDNPSPQLGPMSRMVYQEIGALVDPSMSALEVSELPLDDQLGLIYAVLRQEEDTALGNLARSMFAGITTFAREMTMTARTALSQIGSPASGGTTTSSSPSEKPTDGPTTTSSDSPSSESSRSSARSSTGTAKRRGVSSELVATT